MSLEKLLLDSNRAAAFVGPKIFNRALVFSPEGISFQSRERVLTLEQDNAGYEFLMKVLRARDAGAGLLLYDMAVLIAAYSGGVLRDLLGLARSAAQIAYMTGAEQILAPHVQTAAEQMGRKYMLGLTPAELETLQRLRTSGVFIQTSDEDLALLMTGRILEYPRLGQIPRFKVHPTIEPLLQQLAEAK